MRISFDVCGFYDWEHADKHPGVEIKPSDVKALRAKQLHDGKWAIRVEKQLDTHHDVMIPELSVCLFMTQQAAHAGKELTREDAVCHFLRESNKHHITRKHVKGVSVHDDGPNADLMKAVLASEGIDGAVADGVMERYLEPSNAQAFISAQFGPKGV